MPIENCDPIVYMKDLHPHQIKLMNGTRPSDDLELYSGILDMTAMPCGLSAKYMFNDTFQLQEIDQEGNVIDNI